MLNGSGYAEPRREGRQYPSADLPSASFLAAYAKFFIADHALSMPLEVDRAPYIGAGDTSTIGLTLLLATTRSPGQMN